MLDYMSQIHGPTESQAIEHVMTILSKSTQYNHLLKNVSDEKLRMITKKQLDKMGGYKILGSQTLWSLYTSKDLLERVRQELSIIADFA